MIVRVGLGSSPQSIPDATASSIADALNWVRNGFTTAPAPGAGLPAYSAPPAPPNDQMITWTPDDMAAAALKQFELDKAAQSQAIADAEASGAYNPNFLPNLAGDFKTMLMWAGLVVGAVLLVGVVLEVKR